MGTESMSCCGHVLLVGDYPVSTLEIKFFSAPHFATKHLNHCNATYATTNNLANTNPFLLFMFFFFFFFFFFFWGERTLDEIMKF
jgi:hypothetical protein